MNEKDFTDYILPHTSVTHAHACTMTIRYKTEGIPKTWLDEMILPNTQFEWYVIQGNYKSSIAFRPSKYFPKDVYLVDTKTSEHLSIKKVEFSYPEVYSFIIKNIDTFMIAKPYDFVVVHFDDFENHILPQMTREG